MRHAAPLAAMLGLAALPLAACQVDVDKTSKKNAEHAADSAGRTLEKAADSAGKAIDKGAASVEKAADAIDAKARRLGRDGRGADRRDADDNRAGRR